MASFAEEAGINWSPEQYKKMFESTEMKSPRDALVNIVAKAMTTGSKKPDKRSPRDEAFFAGRVTGFVASAAMLAELMYGCDFDETRKLIAAAVKEVRSTWDRDSLRDPGRVGNTATEIVTTALLEA